MNNNEKKKLFSLFKDVEQKNAPKEQNINSNVLIVDGNNTYMRAYSVNPALNDDGEHVGGIYGFFQSIGYAIRMIRPTRCIVVFDGKGGSKRRRSIYPNYKNKRKSIVRLNRVYEELTDQGIEEKNILKEMQKIVVLSKRLPLSLIAVDDIEADDTISFLSTEYFNNDKSEYITIMSSDQDFYQLINDKVKVWSPTKKRMYGQKEIIDEFGIPPENFIFYKIIKGDTSDNIDGIKGVGLSTAKKVLPIIFEDKNIELKNVLSYIEESRNGKYKVNKSLYDGIDIIKRNYELMQLTKTEIPSFNKTRIQDAISKIPERTNVYEFTSLLKKYKMLSVFKNHHIWLNETFSTLNYFSN